MKFIISGVLNEIYIEKDKDSLVQELYDISELASIKTLYFRGVFLRPDKKIDYYFPYDMPKIYLHDKPYEEVKQQQIPENQTTQKTTITTGVKICIIVMGIYLVALSIANNFL